MCLLDGGVRGGVGQTIAEQDKRREEMTGWIKRGRMFISDAKAGGLRDLRSRWNRSRCVKCSVGAKICVYIRSLERQGSVAAAGVYKVCS